jgi:hypothetical protein
LPARLVRMMGVVDSRHLAGQVEASFDRNRDHGDGAPSPDLQLLLKLHIRSLRPRIRRSGASTTPQSPERHGRLRRDVLFAPTTATGTPTKLFSLGGLTLKAVCAPAGGGLGDVQILATTEFTHAHLSSVMWNSGNGGQADGLHVTDFSSQTEDLTDSNDWGETSFTYTRSGGVVVNGQLAFDDSEIIGGDIFGHTRQCLVSGLVMSTASK